MKRGAFLKNLVALIIAPKAVVEIAKDIKPPVIEYAFEEGAVVAKYFKGYIIFSDQLLKNLPFMRQTLPRLLKERRKP